MLLSDLPLDAFTSILKFLAPKDLVVVGLTCTRLAEAANQESLWASHCCSWVARQPKAAGVVDVKQLQQERDVRTYRHIYRILHGLGSWPVGVWYCTSDEACRPRGEVLVIEGTSCVSFTASLLSAGAVPNPPIVQEDAWGFDRWFSIYIGTERVVSEEFDAQGKPLEVYDVQPAIDVFWLFPGDATNSLAIFESGLELVIYTGYDEEELSSPPGARLFPGRLPPGYDYAPPAADRREMRFQRLSLGWPLRQQPALGTQPAGAGQSNHRTTFDGAAVLRRLEGVFTACYGPHGLEILRLEMAGPEVPPPPGCGITGARLQAFKITGDPNVDALRYSFVVDAAQGRAGRYDPEQDDPFPLPGGLPRMVLAFYEAATLVVHLEQRPAVARFRAQGQINARPGVWEPQFVAATLVVYEEGYHIPFTVIFEDEGVHVRHAMDFFPFTLPIPGHSAEDEGEQLHVEA